VQELVTFVKESWQELHKVTWPGRKEILASSAVVVVVALVFMLLIYVEDSLIHFALNALFK
jgi:preprotein translocase subunit SecE